jgi:uncharacterized membrane protein
MLIKSTESTLDNTMKRVRQFVITTLIGGFLVLLPLAIVVLIVNLILRFIVQVISPLTHLVNWEVSGFWINGFVLLSIIAFCFLVGLAIRTQLGRTSLKYFEIHWLERIPAYGTIRDIVQQFTGAKKAPFQRVVLVDAFNSGTRMIGFITDEDEKTFTVFVPTAPNPTNGFVFHLPKDKVIPLDVRAEEAIRTVVGLGVGSLALIERINQVAMEKENVSPDVQSGL